MTIHQHCSLPTARPVRSTYLRQVERIAPPQLVDRDAELAELAAFCLEEQRGSYVWWRAGPWAGKSALLSTFVLNPPASLAACQVRLVSFFITARLAAQDTREAFATLLTEQLCALLDLDLPAGVNEATQEATLLDLLAQAAAACQRAGGRLVLVVDGLDEDRGVTTGPGTHSIAGLLPGHPPAGMRIIVAGRPNPPIPDDVPDWHPLRAPGIIRMLSDSPQARDLQRLSQSELVRLLDGTPVEQDLLGLLTAARGGLTGPDLRELTGADLVNIERILHTVSGRTFNRRFAAWRPDNGSQVYLLGHEELHNAACHYLGSDRLAGYRNRLHAWAEGYSTSAGGQQSWPPHTPEYLLTGYSRLLFSSGDFSRLADLATDPPRHNRMLDLSGGDIAALTEIRICQDLLLQCPEPDLYTLGRLSHHRGQLESRNAHIPSGLPAVWATLGQSNRAEALAHAISDPELQANALALVVRAVAATGDHQRAMQISGTIAKRDRQAAALGAIAEAVAITGDHGRAEQIAHTVTDPWWQAVALGVVAKAVAAAGDHGRAEQIAHAITDPRGRVNALGLVVEALAAAGEHQQALDLATAAETIADTITDSYQQQQVRGAVAKAVAAAGDHGRAEQIAHAITDSLEKAFALNQLARAVAATGAHEWAQQIARTITDQYQQTQALGSLALAAHAAGDHQRATELATDAEGTARTITNPRHQAVPLSHAAEVAAAVGDHQRARRLATDAERIARSTTDPDQQTRELTAVAEAVAAAGDHQRARRLATDAERIARTFTDEYRQTEALTEVARVLAAAGDYERAEQIARTINDPDRQTQAFAAAAQAAAAAGLHQRALGLAAKTVECARATFDWGVEKWVLGVVAGVLAAAGDHERAEQIARTINDPDRQIQALAEVAEAAAAAGDHQRAGRLAAAAERIAHAISGSDEQVAALGRVVVMVAAVGDHQRARRMATDGERIARSISDARQQMRALARAAKYMAVAGDHEQAEQIARSITEPRRKTQALTEVAGITGRPRASHLLGQAFVLGSWLTPLPVLAQLYPREVIRISDAVYSDGGIASTTWR
ncbi:hypothetical protein ACFWJM_05270 [Streptomyces sp. NPDC127077]|uniref:hypothetical protein n=1 Tax=Streptomyces sp. NPDC127077 TaxID=3347131 RepID=UPI00364DA6DF